MKWVIILFLLVIGFTSNFYGFRLLKLYRKIKRWDKIKAKVLTKKVIPKRLAAASRVNKTVSIEYSFQSDGQTYMGNRVFLVELLNGERGFYESDAKKFLTKIADEITVYANPANPTESVIFCDGLLWYVLMIGGGMLMMFIGLVYILT